MNVDPLGWTVLILLLAVIALVAWLLVRLVRR